MTFEEKEEDSFVKCQDLVASTYLALVILHILTKLEIVFVLEIISGTSLNQGKFTCLWIFPWTIFDLSSCKGGLGKSLFDQIREIKVSMRQALEIITSQVFLHDLLKYFKIHILYKFSFTLKCKLAVLHVQNAL